MQVFNTERHFGENQTYVYRQVNGEDALFTEHELRNVLERARKNKEDLPSFWQRFICRIFGIRTW